MVTTADLTRHIETTALAFRGYDVANLGRSRELLEHPVYGSIVHATLDRVSEICSEVIHSRVDLAEFIQAGEKTSLATFPHDIATIVGMELAQLSLLEEVFEVPIRQSRMTFGYSIGELSALIFGGSYTLESLLPVPLEMAHDCGELAADTTLGVLFTRGATLRTEDVERLCRVVSGEGKGLIGPSAYLSPNTALLLGQGDTLNRIEQLMGDFIPDKVMLRRNPNQWPPLHSPLVWQRHIPNRTAMMLYQLEETLTPPSPTVLSMVTGEASHNMVDSRDVLIRWTDHPQRLWDVIDETLSSGVEFVVHVGPTPSLIAATFARLENNVIRQMGNGNKYLHILGRGLASELNRHAWLTRLLPSKAALLRTPYISHVILEDWLLEQPLPETTIVAIPQEIVEPTERLREVTVLEPNQTTESTSG
ncbi:[acyl-carrier-protein] S-malonyltransferase [Singulisphaera sp. GP187]|uniref:ACP S-malonyltransferase n=1 Tax=Singulisphaera sp. GP187 TaxID=1882752 RepID=UPI000927E922|nr:ACP S-malonyltransferase [Singulisphaera sp. GP187]SIO58353.1 [acyl-carrier-protein] S-malonyltransferase [Singulisphaera sp. GP187]